MRGEYAFDAVITPRHSELPPRARRIPIIVAAWFASIVNYLRVRGEYAAAEVGHFNTEELPPRARRIPFVEGRHPHRKGTTSACAENTTGVNLAKGLDRNYLRVRGEYARPDSTHSRIAELPPRARRIQII